MMSFRLLALLIFAIEGVLASFSLDWHTPKPPYFLLVGDSIVNHKGGWGDGFLSFILDPAKGENHGKSGATTVSFRKSGLWDAIINATKEYGRGYEPIVTIHLGHNDQKPKHHISLKQFQANLESLTTDVLKAGGTPILITSMSRRVFSNGTVIQDLKEERLRAIAAAEAVGVEYLDLNQASVDYINGIGQDNADYYNRKSWDRAHLNEAGTPVFGRMVVDLLLRKRNDLRDVFEKAGLLSEKIWSGEFATGDES